MKEYTVSKSDEGQRLDKYLGRILVNAPGSFIYKMLRKKNIKLNDSKASGSEKLNDGDNIKIYLSDETFDSFCAKESVDVSSYEKAYKTLKNINIVYEDDDMVVFNKPSNVLSQKSKPSDISMNEYLIGYLLNCGIVNENSLNSFKPSILNRLDRNTKGLIIGSKTLKGSTSISAMIKDRSLKKYYKATCMGRIDSPMLLDDYLIKDEKTNKVKVIKDNIPGSSPIKTYVTPINNYDDRTQIEIELITGKSHQIRAHMAFINHPLLGDYKYGNKSFNEKYGVNEQVLCAYKLVFPSDCPEEKWNNLIIKL